MPKFAANLTMLFTERPFLDRFAAAADAGFEAVEFLLPYDFPKHEIMHAVQSNGLQVILHNLPCGNWAGGDRGIGCLPNRMAEFRAGVARAIDYAQELGCPRLNCLAGILPAGTDPADAHATLVENLRFAASELHRAGLQLVLEPVNTRDIPGFFVTRTKQAIAILNEVGAPNLSLQYDIYHAQVMEGDIVRTMEANWSRIGHIQLADNPGRGEPGTGELNFPFLFDRIDALGYDGWIGCEYKPTDAGLAWFAPFQSKTKRETAS